MHNRPTLMVFAVLLISAGWLFAQEQDESFDPSILKDKEPDWPILINPAFGLNPVLQQSDTTEKEITEVEGYRLQVFATTSWEAADSLKTVLQKKLKEDIYVTFEVPNYKVRVGNCSDRNEAEILKTTLKSFGYRYAWIVRARIKSKD